MRNIFLAATALALLSIPTHGKSPTPSRDRKTVPKVTAESYLDQFVDRSVSPRDDFFHFAGVKWLKAHPIPPSEKSWGISHVVQEETYKRLLEVSKAAATDKSAAAGSN